MYLFIACVLSNFSRVRLFAILWSIARQAPLSMEWNSSDKNTEVGCRVLLWWIFLIQGLNQGLLASCIAGGFFPVWAAREAPIYCLDYRLLFV